MTHDDYPPARPDIVLPLKICVGITSALSIIGGFLLVLTFCLRVCERERRLRPRNTDTLRVQKDDDEEEVEADQKKKSNLGSGAGRLILVNLSIADIIVAASHLWGAAGNYETYFHHNQRADVTGPNGSTDAECDVQGAFAVYGTIASFLWTITLSFFAVATMMSSNPQFFGTKWYILLLYHLFGWGLPAVIVIVVAAKRALGLADQYAIAWCYILPRTDRDNLFMNLFAYNVWCYLTIILLLLFFFVALFYNCYKKKGRKVLAKDVEPTEGTPLIDTAPQNTEQSTNTKGGSEVFKLIFAALALVFLRIWDAIYASLGYHKYDDSVEESTWILVLIFLVGIGNSAQGFVNAIFFLLFTNTYRTWIVKCFKSSEAENPVGGDRD